MDKRQKRAKRAKERKAAQGRAQASASRVDPAAIEQALKSSHADLRAGKLERAEKALRRALKAAPGETRLVANLLNVLENQGRHVESLATAERCVKLNPDSSDAHNNLGALRKFEGQLDEAAASFRRAVELGPRHAEAWRNLGSVQPYTDPQHPDFAAMEQALGSLPARGPLQVSLHFALGRGLEQVGRFDEAFEHYASGNRHHRSRMSYRKDAFEQVVDRTIDVQDAAFLGGTSMAPTSAGEAPILVVGMPRSGSTLVEQILSSHPAVEGAGEVPDLPQVLRPYSEDPTELPNILAGLDSTEHAAIGQRYAARLRARAQGAERVVDKYLTNFLHAGILHRALPSARIVHCRRGRRDNGFACFATLFTTSVPFVYQLDEIAHAMDQHDRMLAHWIEHIPGYVLEVSYEDLVRDQEAQTRRLLEFAGLPWDEACLGFHATRRRVTSASAAQVRQPLYTHSIGRAEPFARWLDPLAC